MVITSKANPLIKKIVSLADKKYRKEYGEYLVEGTKPVRECLKTECNIATILCTPEYEDEFPGAVVLTRDLFKAVSTEKTPQGVMAVVKLPNTQVVKPKNNCLLLDGLQDPGNVGTIIRTANACGYRELYFINCADPFSPKSVRASMSGIFYENIYIGTQEEVLNSLSDVALISADMNGENIFTFKTPEKFCLCIGNEGNGLSEAIRKASKFTISIPMEDTCESLNAGVSAGIAMYQLKYKK